MLDSPSSQILKGNNSRMQNEAEMNLTARLWEIDAWYWSILLLIERPRCCMQQMPWTWNGSMAWNVDGDNGERDCVPTSRNLVDRWVENVGKGSIKRGAKKSSGTANISAGSRKDFHSSSSSHIVPIVNY